jgi:hypothetical protein
MRWSGSPQRLNPDNLIEFGAGLYGRAFNLAFGIPVALHQMATRELLLNDLDRLKQGNDEIFNDAGWAHQAYLEQGLEAIESNVDEREKEYLLAGFRDIDAGAKKLANPNQAEEGHALIRAGNRKLLRHEQERTLLSAMGDLSDLGRIIVSLASALDFHGNGGLNAADTPSFSRYFGVLSILSRERCVANFTDRWEWIEQDVLKLWYRFEEGERTIPILKQRLHALAEREPSALQQVAALLKLYYPLVGLKINDPALLAATERP